MLLLLPDIFLQNPSIELKESMDSYQIGMISDAYGCFAGGFLLLLVAAWFAWRNRQALEQSRERTMHKAASEKDSSSSSSSQQGPTTMTPASHYHHLSQLFISFLFPPSSSQFVKHRQGMSLGIEDVSCQNIHLSLWVKQKIKILDSFC